MTNNQKILYSALAGMVGAVLAGEVCIGLFYRKQLSPSDLSFLVLTQPLNCSGFFGLIVGLLLSGFSKEKISCKNLVLRSSLSAFILFFVFLLNTNWMMDSGFLAARIRSKVSITKSHQQAIATSLERYFHINNEYPRDQNEFERYFVNNSSETLNAKEPFHNDDKEFIRYLSNEDRDKYLLISFGPNKRMDIPENILTSKSGDLSEGLIPWTYDVSNGTVSNGDIWRLSP